MKATAIVFKNVSEVTLEEIELPQPTAEDIVVETLVSGVSVGTERWALIGKRAEMKFPHIPGYMGIGKVVEAGDKAAAKGFRTGRMVNFFQSRMPKPYSDNSWMGAHLSKAVIDVSTALDWNPEGMNVHRCELLPEGMDPLDASLTGLCGVAMRGIEMAVVPAASKVLVVGVGVIGQYAAQVCRCKGALVAVSDVSDDRLAIAKKLGAELVVNSKKENLNEKAKEFAPQGFDIIIDTSSSAAVVHSVFPLLRQFGKFVFQGWYPPPTPLDLNLFHGKLPSVFFPCAHSGRAVAAAMRLVNDKRLNTRDLLTHVASPKDAAKIYQMVEKGSDDFLGIAFDWRKQ